MSPNSLQPPLSASSMCVRCFRGTDTAIAFCGQPEWCVAGLILLGVPSDEAIKIFEDAHPTLSDVMTVTYRVCRRCVRKSGKLPDPALTIPGAEIPCLYQTGIPA